MNTKSNDRLETTRLLAKAFNINDFLDPTSLAHDELSYYNTITRAFDKTISKYIDWLGSDEAREVFYEDIKNREKYFKDIDKDIDDIIQDTSLSADEIIEKIYRKGLQQGYKDINRLLVFNDACKYGLKATQEYNFELIRNVSEDLKNSIKHHIFRGVAEGQSIPEVAKAITESGLQPLEGKTLTAYQRASLIARTEIARSMTTGRLQSYANYGVEKVKILTAGDDNVCPICLEAAHKFNGEKTPENIIGERVYDLDKASDLVPFHPACRCSVIAYIEHYQDLPQKPIKNPPIIDCEINNNPNIPGDPIKDYNFTDRNESRRIAKELGYEYVPLREGDEKFIYKVQIDNQFKEVELFFSGNLLKALDNRQYGDIYYSKKEILNVFKNSPEWLKLAPKRIEFINSFPKERRNVTGYHKRGRCFITPLAFQTSQFSHSNLPFTLYHEMAHAFDWRMSILGKYGLSEESNEYYSPLLEDNKYIRQTRGEIGLSVSTHALTASGRHEDFAESLAMVALGQSKDKKYAILTLSNDETVHYHDWKNIFRNRNQYFQEYLSKDTKEIINNFKKKIKLSNH